MVIRLTCACGKPLTAPEDMAGNLGKCPACGSEFRIPAAGAVGGPGVQGERPWTAEPDPLPQRSPPPALPAGPPGIAPPPTAVVRLPAEVPEKLRRPGMPPCWLDLSVQGAVIKAGFDVAPVLAALVAAFASKLKKTYDVRLGAAPADGSPSAEVRVVLIDEGNRFLRYVFTFFAGKTCFEVAGCVTGPAGRQVPIQFHHKSSGGFFGGSASHLLLLDAVSIGTQVAKALLKATK